LKYDSSSLNLIGILAVTDGAKSLASMPHCLEV